MKSFQAPAIRICGAATFVGVLISFVQIGGLAFELHPLPMLSMSILGLAGLVAFAAFLVANAPRFAIAESICKCSVAVIAVLSVLGVYTGVASLWPLDLALAVFLYALLAELCRRVLARRAAAA